ncbi:putative autophagy protein Atg13 [Aspergillus chevalieri]|uniref:Autophagy-related protein 13 n=1 Tax=Aspergillus chevalieri TaxID=182096 RepID=A0A7R7ZTI9_ASPCH|nr:autophagy protein 13 [Aspergillus chevalieri]BCR92522.1 autophagy protein 13 [Aspergillus chevalieri]
MHQHPRSSAPTAPPRPNSSRSIDPPGSPTSDTRTNSSRGLGTESGSDSSEWTQKAAPPTKEVMAKLNQIISNYHTKAALIILHSRVELPPSFSKGSDTPKVNRWFNVELDDTDALKDQLRTWRFCDATENRPPPLIIETYLDTRNLTNNQSLVILDENGKRWDVLESLAISREAHPSKAPQTGSDDIILERWKVELGDTSSRLPADLGSILPTVYKKSIVLFRSLFAHSKFLPAWKLTKRNRKQRTNPALQIKYRILDWHDHTRKNSALDHLTVPLYETSGKVVDTHTFGTTESPAGPFSVEITYRTSCDFRVDDSEALLSSRFMGADDEIFRPSIPSEAMGKAEVGSVPIQKQLVGDPDPSRAYGSLSTFHHVGPTTGASPISALRMARDTGALSPSPAGSPSHPRPLSTAKISSAGRTAVPALTGEGGHARRSSMSFQPFKAPPLSASPSLVDPSLGASPRSSASRLSFEPKNVPPTSVPMTTRKPMPANPENTIASSNSASPRPASSSRYSSAFSHRRSRPSFGGSNKAEDEGSSGKASAASSAQPGSGLLAEPTGTSADSIHADDENISEFLKMLDLRKDLMNPTSSAVHDAPSRRTTATTAALNRFQRMRDSNAALSDSMSSSLHLHRSSSSSSKQLSGVPPMVAGTSVSTASSPGKPVSPHTPHTPAIPSRLSSNSIVAYNEPEGDHQRFASDGHGSSLDDNNAGGDITQTNAIDIPRSPFLPAYTGSTDVGSGPTARTSVPEEDDDMPFPMRSVSAGDRPTHSLSAMQQNRSFGKISAVDDQPRRATHPSSLNDDSAVGNATGPYRDNASHRTALNLGPTATSSSSNNHMYLPRSTHPRGRGSSGGARSLSSGSGSLARGGIPHSFPERDHGDGNGSGSNSGSALETRRGSGQRPGSSRTNTQQTPVDEEEPLLFAMSDFGTSRRSLEEGRQGNHGSDPSGSTGSRRGSGRRGIGPPGFHVWS